jgi:hypothetical protein
VAPRLTHEQIAATQATFREANEKIEAAADEMGLVGAIPFICECADARCVAIVRLTPEQYEDVRRHPRRFFALPGHQSIAVAAGAAEMVFAFPDYVLVDKIGIAGDISEQDFDDQVR